GGFIHIYGTDGKQLASLVVGDNARVSTASMSATTQVNVRFGDEPATYRVSSDIRSQAKLWSEKLEGKVFVEREVFKLPESEEIRSVRLVGPGQPDLLVERRYRTKPGSDDAANATSEGDAEKKDEAKKPEKEEYFVVTQGSETFEIDTDMFKARSLLDRGKAITVEDVADPKGEGYGFDAPALEAVITYATKGDEGPSAGEYTIA